MNGVLLLTTFGVTKPPLGQLSINQGFYAFRALVKRLNPNVPPSSDKQMNHHPRHHSGPLGRVPILLFQDNPVTHSLWLRDWAGENTCRKQSPFMADQLCLMSKLGTGMFGGGGSEATASSHNSYRGQRGYTFPHCLGCGQFEGRSQRWPQDLRETRYPGS